MGLVSFGCNCGWGGDWKDSLSKYAILNSESELEPTILDESLQCYQRKYLILVGAVKSLLKANITVTHEAVAEQLGLTLEQLNSDYRGLYEIYLDNKKHMLRLVDIRNMRF